MDDDSRTPDPQDRRVVVPASVELIDPQREHTPPPPRRQLRVRPRLTIGLFVATCITTFLAGMNLADSLAWSALLRAGFEYSGALMLILLAHEMGHYLQSVRYGVPATLPFFIPMPFTPFGTMGAVILQGGGADRKQLFDIAISGPLAGLVFALPIAWFGAQQSQVVTIPDNFVGLIYSDPLILKWMIESVHGPLAPNQEVALNPLLFAGWVGIFITGLNLVPVGQFDGGHIMYALIGRRAHFVAYAVIGAAFAYIFSTGYPGFVLILILLLLMGPRHPPTADDTVPLGMTRKILGWLTLGFILIGLTPNPIVVVEPERKPPRQTAPTPQVVQTGDAAHAAVHGRSRPRSPANPIAGRPRRQRSGSAADWSGYFVRSFMKASASRASCSSDWYIRRQIFVAAARSGSASPKASTISHPS